VVFNFNVEDGALLEIGYFMAALELTAVAIGQTGWRYCCNLLGEARLWTDIRKAVFKRVRGDVARVFRAYRMTGRFSPDHYG